MLHFFTIFCTKFDNPNFRLYYALIFSFVYFLTYVVFFYIISFYPMSF